MCEDATAAGASVGLCAACRHSHRIRTARDSVFYRCRRAETEAKFARYPRLPVLQCPGFEPECEAKPALPK